MKTVFAGLVVSAAALLSSGQAFATPLTFTYEGTVSYGVDNDGLFGAAGTDLAGKTFKLIETFDLSKAAGSYSYFGYNVSYGGAKNGSADFATSKIKIGSSAFYAISNDYSSLVSANGSNSNAVQTYNSTYGNNVYSWSGTYTSLNAYSPYLTGDNQPTKIQFDGQTSYGYGYFNDYSYNYDYNNWNFQSATHAYANLNLQSLTIASVSAVPLPASAPMFGAALLGLGAVGFGVRRRKAAAAAA